MKHISYVALLMAHSLLLSGCFNRGDLYITQEDDPSNVTVLLPTLVLKRYTDYPSCHFNQVARCSAPPCLNVCFIYAPTSWRLDASGQNSSPASGNAGQRVSDVVIYPRYLELSPNAATALGSGQVLYQTATHDGQPETGTGATILDDITGTAQGEVAFSFSIASIARNFYQYLRVGIAYYQGRTGLRHNTGSSNLDMSGVVGAFTGTRVQATTITLNGTAVALNTNVSQGFWVYKGDSLAKIDGTATTVTAVNPIADTSTVPTGSDVITGAFTGSLDLSGSYDDDLYVMAILSTNQSFEWVDSTADGAWGGSGGESVYDFAFRSLRMKIYQ